MSIHTCSTCGKHGDVAISASGERHAHLASCMRSDCPSTMAAARFAALIPQAHPSETILGFCETTPAKTETFDTPAASIQCTSKSVSLGVASAVRCAIAIGLVLPDADVDDWLLYTKWANRMVLGTAERTHDRTDYTIMRLCNHYDDRVRKQYREGMR